MNFDNKKYMDDTGAKKLISLVQDAITALDEGKANKTNTVNNVQYRVGNSITQSINGTDTTIVYVTDTPTENSNALITAGGVKNALDNVEPTEMTAAQVQTIWDSVPGGVSSYKDITGTLVAGNTSLTLSDDVITSAKTFDFYTDTFGVNPTDVTVSSGSMTLTFDTQSNDVSVKVRVWN